MRMSATLPPLPFADHVLQDRCGPASERALSVEFRAIKERVENGIRIIEKALLRGVGLLKAPDYGALPRGSPRTSAKGLAVMAALPSELTAIIPNVASENAGGILGRDAPDSTRATALAAVALRLCYDYAPTAPIEVMQEAAVRLAGWLWGRAPHLTGQRLKDPSGTEIEADVPRGRHRERAPGMRRLVHAERAPTGRATRGPSDEVGVLARRR